jgi:hypothetical protein
VSRLAERAGKKFRVVDEKQAYYRLLPDETAQKTYTSLRKLLTADAIPVGDSNRAN